VGWTIGKANRLLEHGGCWRTLIWSARDPRREKHEPQRSKHRKRKIRQARGNCYFEPGNLDDNRLAGRILVE
jgi:hypothetical protein